MGLHKNPTWLKYNRMQCKVAQRLRRRYQFTLVSGLNEAKTPRGMVWKRLHKRDCGVSAVWEGSYCLERVLTDLGNRSKLVIGGARHLRIVKGKVTFKSSGRIPTGRSRGRPP